MNLDLSFVTKIWVQQQIRKKTITKHNWTNGLIYLKPLNIYFDDEHINRLGKGILVDPFYNIIHASCPRVSVLPNIVGPANEMHGGVLLRAFWFNEKWCITRMMSPDIPEFPTSGMEHLFQQFQTSITNNRNMYTCLIGLKSFEILYTLVQTNQNKFYLTKSSSNISCKLNSLKSQETLNLKHYVTYRLFQNNVYNLYNLYVQCHIKKKRVYIPKKYKSLLYELHGLYLSSEKSIVITKKLVGDAVMSLNPWKLENLLLS